MNRTAAATLMAQYATPTVSGNGRVEWDNGLHSCLPSVKIYGKCEQDGTPTPVAPVPIRCHNGTLGVYGRNLFDPHFHFGYGWGDELVTYASDNEVVLTQPDTRNYILSRWLLPNLPVGTKLTVYVDAVPSGNNNPGVRVCYLSDNGYTQVGTAFSDIGWNWRGGEYCGVATINEPCPVGAQLALFLYSNTNGAAVAGDTVTYRNVRMYVGEYTMETLPAWEPFAYHGSAAVPELYAIPGTDYVDEWDAQTGKGVRRCGVIESYAGEEITTPYISTTGALTTGATVVYGLARPEPFSTLLQPLIQPKGYGQILQTAGDVTAGPLAVRYLTHS